MISKEVYRQHAQECLQLAETSTDVYVKVALTELAQEFNAAADETEGDAAADETEGDCAAADRRARARTMAASEPVSLGRAYRFQRA